MSAELDELARKAEAEKRKADDAVARRDHDAQKVSRRAKARIARRAAGGEPAPTSLFQSMRFFYLIMSGGVIVVFAAMAAIAPEMVPWKILGIGAAVWVMAFAICYGDAASWRKRLPFALDGYDWIHGEDPTADDDDAAPWVALRVEIELGEPSVDAALHRANVLEILASRVNAELTRDRDVDFGAERRWRVDPREGTAAGEATRGIYSTRRIEGWLRGEVRTFARAHPIKRVAIHARYTGSRYSMPSGD